jgi:hypothetical protein
MIGGAIFAIAMNQFIDKEVDKCVSQVDAFKKSNDVTDVSSECQDSWLFTAAKEWKCSKAFEDWNHHCTEPTYIRTERYPSYCKLSAPMLRFERRVKDGRWAAGKP